MLNNPLAEKIILQKHWIRKLNFITVHHQHFDLLLQGSSSFNNSFYTEFKLRLERYAQVDSDKIYKEIVKFRADYSSRCNFLNLDFLFDFKIFFHSSVT